MATARGMPLATVRTSVSRIQREGERMVARLRHDAGRFVARGRDEALREVRDLERKVLKGLHAASREQFVRLERRVATLEQSIAALRKPTA